MDDRLQNTSAGRKTLAPRSRLGDKGSGKEEPLAVMAVLFASDRAARSEATQHIVDRLSASGHIAGRLTVSGDLFTLATREMGLRNA